MGDVTDNAADYTTDLDVVADPDLLLDLRNVSLLRDGRALLDDITWQVALGERWVILGPNGAGKTTLIRIAGAEEHPTSGRAYVLGERIGRTALRDLRTMIGVSSAALGGREDLVTYLSALALDEDAPATVMITHHVEEIPEGFTHAMLLDEGVVVAQGPIDEVLTSENLSRTFHQPIELDRIGGRYFARRVRAGGTHRA